MSPEPSLPVVGDLTMVRNEVNGFDEDWLQHLTWRLLIVDGEIARYRVKSAVSDRDWLVMRAASSTSENVFRRINHEYELRGLLAPEWAVMPVALLASAEGPLLVLDDSDGRFLHELADDTLSIDRFLHLALGAAQALGQAHAKGILHRDIKPCNLIEGADGVVRLTAFALSVRASQHVNTSANYISGSLAYMSPEQARRVGGQVDERSDLYSLGVSFYEMLTQRLPFEGNDPVEWLHQHLALQPAAPEHWRDDIPPPLGRLVLKLLEKDPWSRYSCASALEADLRLCLAHWNEFRYIQDFEPGGSFKRRSDPMGYRLVGRCGELIALHESIERVVTTGESEIVLLSGPAGIGKTALIRQLHQELAGRRIRLAMGKSDPYQLTTPFASLTLALRSLILGILGEDPLVLAAWRGELLNALGTDCRLIANLVPEIELITGKLPTLNVLPADVQARFYSTLRRFISVVASEQCPLILIFDDLQRLDDDTLAIFLALGKAGIRYLTIIGAFRNDLADHSPAFSAFCEDMQAWYGPLTRLSLQPLNVEGVERMLSAALDQQTEPLGHLSKVMHDKTAGNPFFINQLLQTLLDERLIDQARNGQGWVWDASRISEFPVAENVIELMLGRIGRLPRETRRLLGLLAMVGNRAYDVDLACFCGSDIESIRLRLAPAIDSGLLLEDQGGLLFSHDRVREAAYLLIPAGSRADEHARMAKLLIDQSDPQNLQAVLFRVSLHIQQSANAALSDADKALFIDVLLQAAHRAKDTGAVSFALEYLQLAQVLGGEQRWRHDYSRNYAIDFLQAQCLVYTGEYTEADERITRLLSRVYSLTEVSSLYVLKVESQSLSGDYAAAIRAALEGLALFGIDLTGPNGSDDAQVAYARLKEKLGQRSIESLVDLPLLQNSPIKAAIALLASMIVPTSFTDEPLLFLLLCRMVQLTLRHGLTEAAPIGMAWFGIVVAQRFGEYEQALRYADAGAAIVVRRGYVKSEALTWMALDRVSAWLRPMAFSLECAEKAFNASRNDGNPSMAGHASNNVVTNMLIMGAPLDRVEKQISMGLAFSRQSNVRYSQGILSTEAGFVRLLRGAAERSTAEKALCAELEEQIGNTTLTPARFKWWLFKGIANYFFQDYTAAQGCFDKAEDYAWSMPSHQHLMGLELYAALNSAALCQSGADPLATVTSIEPRLAKLRHWAGLNPATFRDKYLLVEAEVARIQGRPLEAMALYEAAIRQAASAGFVHVQALAHELAGRCYQTQGLITAARSHLRSARDGYQHWGATRKARHLEQGHLYLHDQPPNSRSSVDLIDGQQYLDMISVTKASQALSREIVFERLIELLMTNTIVHAGARRGVLILLRDGTPIIAANGEVTQDGVQVGISSRPVDSNELPLSMLYTVLRTRESIALDHASTEETFANDEFFRHHRACSVLCLPLLKQGEVMGALYLENQLASGIFTHSRIAVIEILAAQAAISLETSRLYAELLEENLRRRDTEVALLNARTELASVSQATIMGELAASIAHEINQPLVSIISNASASVRWLNRPMPDVREALEGLGDIVKDSRRASDIVLALQALAKQKAPNRRKLIVDDVVRHVLLLTASEIEQKHVTVISRLEAQYTQVYADAVQLQQVILNLVMNAVDALMAVEVALRTVNIESSVQGGDRVVVTVEDNGPGVTAENQDKIFNAFFTTKVAGMGMGLAICRSIIDANGGTLHMIQRRNGGTLFVFTLPALEDSLTAFKNV